MCKILIRILWACLTPVGPDCLDNVDLWPVCVTWPCNWILLWISLDTLITQLWIMSLDRCLSACTMSSIPDCAPIGLRIKIITKDITHQKELRPTLQANPRSVRRTVTSVIFVELSYSLCLVTNHPSPLLEVAVSYTDDSSLNYHSQT